MIELLIGVGALLAAGFFLVVPALALIALSRSRELPGLRQRIDEIELRLARMERALRERTRVSPEAEAPKAAEPGPAAVPPKIAAAPANVPPPQSMPPAAAPRPLAPIPTIPSANVPPALAASAAPSTPKHTIDWERWIGIRGAAVLGGVVLGIAALLFFQYSIQHGLITPRMRVVIGVAVGLACAGISEWLRPREYRVTAEGLAGAGVVCLYAAFWAAHVRYGLLGSTVTFVMMALITVGCCLLALRHASQTVAVIGLLGGFATPLLIQSRVDRPIGLFGYILLLDVGLLALGRKQRWPSLALLSLLGTVVIEALWIGKRMTPEHALLGLAILAVFAVVFAWVPRERSGDGSAGWLVARAAGVLFPVYFGAYFASRADLGPHLWQLGLFLAILCAAACWVGEAGGHGGIAIGAAAGALSVTTIWLFKHTLNVGTAWEVAATCAGIAAVFHVFVERRPEDIGMGGPAPAAIASALGFAGVAIIASGINEGIAPWPWLAAWLVLAAFAYRHAGFVERAPLQLAAAVATALGASLLHVRHATEAAFPYLTRYFVLLIALAGLAEAAAALRRDETVRVWAERAAAVAACVLIVLLPSQAARTLSVTALFGSILALCAVACIAAVRIPSGPWYAAVAGSTALVHWILVMQPKNAPVPFASGGTLAFLAATVLLLTLVPIVAWRWLGSSRPALETAAVAGCIWLLPMQRVWTARLGDGAIGVLPLALAAIASIGILAARRRLALGSVERERALVWFSAAAILLATVAIPLQLEKQWITVGFALEGLGLILLFRKLPHPGLKYFAVALFAAATVRLVLNPALLGYYPRSGVPIFNWILYTYLVPAGALLASAILLARIEVVEARPDEGSLYRSGHPIFATFLGLAAIAVGFVWLNLAVADWFTEGPTLTVQFGRSAARDLTVSIVWAVYAIALLLVGMFKDSVWLRWLSLGFLVVTIGKVFLYDLGELRDLYRVASLVGLAVSLLLVSLLYQRFVFRRGPAVRERT